MKYALAAFAAAALGISAAAVANAATFVAEVKGDTVTVYSTSTKKEACQLKNTFSFVVEGKRFTTTQTCNVEVDPGTHLEVCKVTASEINQAKIEKPVDVLACTDRK